jgi:pilus assembly protein Flp/PilA
VKEIKLTYDFLLSLYLKITGVCRNSNGQTLLEYGLIVVLIAVVVILVLELTGNKVNNMYSNVASQLP